MLALRRSAGNHAVGAVQQGHRQGLAAFMEFVFAQQDGWSPGADGDLPPGALERLHRAGVGSHGAGAATVFAERWLTAHIEAVYRQNEMTMRGIGDSIDVRDLAEIAALRQLDQIGNRDRAFELERRLPVFFRSIADINYESASMLHIRLDLDHDGMHGRLLSPDGA